MSQFEYINSINKVIAKVDSEEVASAIKAAAALCAETIGSGKLVHMFGSGHSILPVQDVFPRYGGYVGWHPLMDPRLMWHNVIGPNDAPGLLWLERVPGYIANFLDSYDLKEGEVMLVYSHGGANAAPIECALYAKERGLKVIAVTSVDNYRNGKPATYDYNGKKIKLYDVADVVIDNCCSLIDAQVELKNEPGYVGATSTIGAIAVSQTLATETAKLLEQKGHAIEPFVSPNVAGVDGAARTKSNYIKYRKLVVEDLNNI